MSEYSSEFYDASNINDLQTKREYEETIAKLMKENAVIQAQFKQALNISDQLTILRTKNQKLQDKILELQQDKEELEQRLRIAQTTAEEVKQRMRNEIQEYENQRSNENTTAQKEIDIMKRKFQVLLDEATRESSELRTEKTSIDIKYKTLLSKAKSLLSIAGLFHDKVFDSLDGLTEFLNQNKENQRVSEAQQQNQTPLFDLDDYVNLMSKYKTSKKALKDISSKLKDSDEERSKLKSLLRQAEDKNIVMESDYRSKIDKLNSEHNKFKEEQYTRYNALEVKLENLQKLNNDRNNTLRIETIYEPPRAGGIYSDKSNAYDGLNNMNKKNNDELARLEHQKELQRIEIEELKRKLNEAYNRVSQLSGDKEKLQAEISTLKILNEEKNADVETFRKVLYNTQHKEKDKKHTCNKKKKNEVYLLAKISKLESQVDSQKKVLLETQMEVESYKAKNANQNRMIENLKDDNDVLNKQVSDLNSRLSEAKIERMAVVPKEIEEEILPPSIWRPADFETPLQDIIEKIGLNKALQPASRIRQVFKEIASYYSKQEDENFYSCTRVNKIATSIKNAFNDFLVDISISTTGSPLTIEEFSRVGAKDIFQFINNMKEENMLLKRKFDNIEKKYVDICSLFPPDSDILEKIGELLSIVELKDEEIYKRKYKMKDCKAVLQVLEKRLKQTQEEFDDQQTSYSTKINDLEMKLSSANKEVVKLNNEVASLNLNLRDARDQLQACHDYDKIKEDLMNMNNIESSLRSHIRQLNDQLNSLTNENDQLKSVVSKQKATIDDLEAKQRLNQPALFANEQPQNVFVNKENVFDNALDELKRQSEARREEFEKATLEIARLRNKLTDAKESLLSARKEKCKLEAELKIKIDEFEREKKLLSSSHEAALLEMETKMNDRATRDVEAVKRDKREIISQVVSLFQDHVNVSAPIDDKSLRSLLNQAKSEITRLRNTNTTIRRMVHAGEYQTTEDAVACMLLSK